VGTSVRRPLNTIEFVFNPKLRIRSHAAMYKIMIIIFNIIIHQQPAFSYYYLMASNMNP